KLKGVSIPVVGLLFGLSLAVMLLPWLVLPFDEWSLILIALELGSFLVYSIPPLRLKRFPLPACLLDTAYAYVWPMALSMHTFAIQAPWQVHSWFNFLLAALFFIGFRNIVLHQIKDAVADFNSGRKTLPLVVGANKTYRILQLVLALEILLFTLFLLFFHRYGSLFALSYSIYLVWKYNSIQKGLSPLPSQAFQVFYLSDLFYQLWLPMLIIGVLVKQDVRWLYLFLFHLLVLAFNFRRLILGGELAEIYHKTILHGISMVVNTIIYYVFRMFGVDLKLEKMSALDYLNSKKRKQ
ncbi:MAG: UbiA family prenyltransferase, partial [Bacteroidia bacterium]|nr:UbiA family prenyltransferase [Bacteroidia bacterium]